MRLYEGRGVRARRAPGAVGRSARTCAWMWTSRSSTPSSMRCSRRPARSTPSCGWWRPAAGTACCSWSRCRATCRRSGSATSPTPPAHPQWRQVAVLRGQHARHATGAGARVRRGAAGHAARARARGSDLVAVLGPRRRAAHPAAQRPHPGLDHAPGGGRGAPGRRKPRARARSSKRPTRRSWPRRSGRSSPSSPSRAWTWPQGRSRRRRRRGCGSGSTRTCAPTPPSRAGGRREDRPGS